MVRPVVLVHGAWHGAWCWAALQAALDGRGVPSYAIDRPGCGASPLPLDTLAGDAAHVDAVLAALDREVVLVGHSYAGAVVSASSSPTDQLAAVVYVTAFALRAGEAINDVVRAHPSPDPALRNAIVMRDDGTSVLDPGHAVAALYGRCERPAIEAALARIGPHPMATFGEAIETSLIGRVPTTYVRCTLDAAVPPVQQDAMAAHCDEVVSIETDHSPFSSAVAPLADVLAGLAHGRTGNAR